jgi:hypothetical protein
VEVFAMDKSGNLSSGVPSTIQPLTPPVDVIRETLQIQEIFGGLYVRWENTQEKDVAISLYVADSTGYYNLYDTYFSNSSNGNHSFRGLKIKEQDLRVEIRDRWNNYASPLDVRLQPLYEESILGRENSTIYWTPYGFADGTYNSYRGDMRMASVAEFNRIFDGLLFSSTYWGPTAYTVDYFPDAGSLEYGPYPIYFTVDLGRKASYSRMKLYMRDRSSMGSYFSAAIMSVFSVWATNNPKPVSAIGDGSKADNLKYWTSWVQAGATDEWKNDWEKLADCKVVLPSGITKASQTNLTAEDIAFIIDGFHFDVDPLMTNKAFRYLRFEIFELNTNDKHMFMSELQLFGALSE